jgi:hypothetical protein
METDSSGSVSLEVRILVRQLLKILCFPDKNNRALRIAQKIRQRLVGSTNMMEPFPDKPKGMPYDIYMRLFLEYHEVEISRQDT